MVPGGEKVRDVYSVVKGAAGRGAEANAQGGSWGDVAKGTAFGAAEGGMEVWGNHTESVVGNAAINTVKSIISDLYDGRRLGCAEQDLDRNKNWRGDLKRGLYRSLVRGPLQRGGHLYRLAHRG